MWSGCNQTYLGMHVYISSWKVLRYLYIIQVRTDVIFFYFYFLLLSFRQIKNKTPPHPSHPIPFTFYIIFARVYVCIQRNHFVYSELWSSECTVHMSVALANYLNYSFTFFIYTKHKTDIDLLTLLPVLHAIDGWMDACVRARLERGESGVFTLHVPILTTLGHLHGRGRGEGTFCIS